MAGQTVTDLIDLSKIDRTPVTFLLPIKEINCPTAVHEALFHEITAPESYIQMVRGGHLMIFLESNKAQTRHIIQAIETGQYYIDDGEPISPRWDFWLTQIMGLAG